MQIAEIQLYTNRLRAQKVFYHEVFGLPVVADAPTSFTVQAGTSTITFVETTQALPSIYTSRGHR